MINLPEWKLTSKYPAFYDTESGTAIEQTAKVYGAMRELIDEYNAFVESITTRINEFEASLSAKEDEFEVGIRQEFQDFIDVVETKIGSIEALVAGEVEKQLTNFDIGNYVFVYNPETESLDMRSK